MKKVFVMLSLGLLVAGTSFAQDAPVKERKARTERSGREGVRKENITPEQKAEKRAQMLTKKYNLTQAQQEKVRALYLQQAQERTAFKAQRDANAPGNQQQREAMKAKHEQWNAEFQKILTKEQYAQYQNDQKARASRFEGKGGHKGHKMKNRTQKAEQKS
ncbi:hypothetical protein [Rufibacter immobilis]|uniref:hypothetical protein n=1 Tax=Rufibacter immobilis TaxID=1348778 RepID=UPI0035EFCD0E